MTETRPRGRPRKYGRRSNLTFRLRDTTRETLEAEADRNQRSLSEEVEARLERSFDGDDLVRRVMEAAKGAVEPKLTVRLLNGNDVEVRHEVRD